MYSELIIYKIFDVTFFFLPSWELIPCSVWHKSIRFCRSWFGLMTTRRWAQLLLSSFRWGLHSISSKSLLTVENVFHRETAGSADAMGFYLHHVSSRQNVRWFLFVCFDPSGPDIFDNILDIQVHIHSLWFCTQLLLSVYVLYIYRYSNCCFSLILFWFYCLSSLWLSLYSL